MARLQPTALQFDVAIRRTLEATQAAIAETARREHAKIMAAEPRPGAFRRYVDGREGAPEEAVRADGVILYEYDRLDMVVQFAMETLFDLSPVLSGAYRDAHTLFLDGAAVPNLEGWQPGSEVAISNLVPYARKIEQGTMTMRVPGSDHVYEQAERIVMRRMGNLARVSFTYSSMLLPYVALGGKKGGKRASAAKRSAPNLETDSRMPALIITER